MRRWAGLVAVALVAGRTAPSQGQGGGMGGGMMSSGFIQEFGLAGADSTKASQVRPVKITAPEGKSTTGNLRLTTVVVACSLGVYEIKPEKVQEIRLNPPSTSEPALTGNTGVQRPGCVVTVAGARIDGVVLIPNWWRIETELGTLTPNGQEIVSIE